MSRSGSVLVVADPWNGEIEKRERGPGAGVCVSERQRVGAVDLDDRELFKKKMRNCFSNNRWGGGVSFRANE